MDGLVVYYSRTGNTKKIAKVIADKMDFETEQIIDKKDRSGFSGYMKGGWDAWREKRTQIEKEKEQDLSSYDIIVIGTPVWAAKPTPAVNTFLDKKKEEIKKTAFFCTCGGSGYKSTLKQLEKISAKKPAATLAIKEKEIENEAYKKEVEKFAEKCKRKIDHLS